MDRRGLEGRGLWTGEDWRGEDYGQVRTGGARAMDR